MSSMSSVAGLSKYIKTLPSTKKSIVGIFIVSFLTGIIYDMFVFEGLFSSDLLISGLIGFLVLGVSSFLSGSLNQQGVKILHGINLKIKHSMFLSLLSLVIISIMLIIGGLICNLLGIDASLNLLLFSCVLVYGINTLVLWSTTKIGFIKSAIIGALQPLLILAILILLLFLSSESALFSTPTFVNIVIKTIIACVIFILAIYSFIKIIASPL